MAIITLTMPTIQARPKSDFYKVYVSDSALRNPGHAGWANLVLGSNGSFSEAFGSACKATNHEMEIWAMINALQNLPADANGTVHS